VNTDTIGKQMTTKKEFQHG